MVRYTVEQNIEGKQLVCSFAEKLDTAASQQIEIELYEKVRENKEAVIFDLEKVDYICSGFLRIRIRVAKEVGSGNFSVINVTPNIKKVFKIAGLDKQLNLN